VVVSNVLAYCAVSDHDRCPFPPDFPRFAYMIPPVGWTVGVRLFVHSHLLSPPVHFHCYPFLYALVTSCAFYEWPYDPLEYGMSAFGGFETLALTVILMPIFTATRFYLPLSHHVRFFFVPSISLVWAVDVRWFLNLVTYCRPYASFPCYHFFIYSCRLICVL
jgi:hypothetical protein